MKILYLTISNLRLDSNGMYENLIKSLKKRNHNITVVIADGSKDLNRTFRSEECGIDVLRVKVGNNFGVNFFKKGINLLLMESKLKSSINKFLGEEHYDLILYATPPVTFANVIKYCKKKYGCSSYLMLKDIFPQNAIDLELFKENGILHRMFLQKEKKLYEYSDFIGCMSKKNVEYLLDKNKQIDKNKVEIFPNSDNITDLVKGQYSSIKRELNISEECLLLVFGGNMGKPQGIGFLIDCIKRMKGYTNVHFLFVGNGTESEKIKLEACNLVNLTFMERIPQEKYENLIRGCDIGIISLDKRFTIPNYPSRMLSYMDKAMPILACTDRNTDVRELIELEAKCGKWCYSGSVDDFINCVEFFVKNKHSLKKLGLNGRRYMEENFNIDNCIDILEKHFK